MGTFMLTMVGAMYQFKRANMLERQKEGITIAKEEGKYKGRKKVEFPANWEEVYKQYKTRKLKGNEAMEQLGLKKIHFIT
jgi:DNA invertase Pin-like site-specific DNA recombinase